MPVKVMKADQKRLDTTVLPPRPIPAVAKRQQLAAMSLPSERTKAVHDILRYTGLIYGREGIGKTVTLASFPKTIFLPTEPGTKGMEIFQFNEEGGGITDWAIMRRAVELLAEAKAGNPFFTVAIDTGDRAYDMCLDWVCQKLGIDAPGVNSDGVEDYGASWRAVKQEFLIQITTLIQAGYGVWFTSHAKEEKIKPRSGEAFDRIRPTMSGQARSVIEALVDFAFYAEYMTDKKGNEVRVFICQGNETIWAKSRRTPGGHIPKFLPILEEKGFDIIQRAFSGEYAGLDPRSLMPDKRTTKTGKELLQKSKIETTLVERGL